MTSRRRTNMTTAIASLICATLLGIVIVSCVASLLFDRPGRAAFDLSATSPRKEITSRQEWTAAFLGHLT
jgi:hypothetical protein